MKICFFKKNYFRYFLFIYFLIVLSLIYFLPFTLPEAKLLNEDKNYLTNIIASTIYIFFPLKIVLRGTFFIISLGSIWLLFKIATFYFKKLSYIYLTLFIFLITPGFFVSLIILNYSTISIFLILLFIYGYFKNSLYLQFISLVLLFFTNSAHFAVYLALSLYFYKKKNWILLSINVALFILSLIIMNYPISGVPKGHLKTLLGIYAVTFSPFYFLTLVYSLYRIFISYKKDIIWYIASISFTISILLSIRQKIIVIDFTPFIIIAAFLIVLVFKKSISIRLPQFRKNYYRLCGIILLVLLLETSIIAISYPLSYLTSNKIDIIPIPTAHIEAIDTQKK